MAIVESPTATDRDPSGRVILHDISWERYEELRADEANRHIRMAYDDGELELMSPSHRHGSLEVRFDLFLMEVVDVLGIGCRPLGNATWKRPGMKKAKEADNFFYLANLDLVDGLREIDLNVAPPPDLAVEVEISRKALNSLNIYAALGIPEIWRIDGSTFHIHLRQDDGTYREVDHSLALPFLKPNEVVDWMTRGEELNSTTAWKREVREWARVELLSRLCPR